MAEPDRADASRAPTLDAARAEPYRLEELLRIMAVLRTPVIGCPWDVEQDFRSIAPYTLEEAYEVADAIERGNLDDLREELGDLLLQVVFHTRMAEEQGSFAFADVVDTICRKLVRRHPHVFGDARIREASEVKGLWDRVKAEEKAEKRGGAAGEPESLLDSVPAGLPALARAVKLQDKAAKIGFDWPSIAPVLAKLSEEIGELQAEIEGGGSQGAIAEEYGDMLFVFANIARHLKLDPEAALRAANAKFDRRFRHVEMRLREDGRTPADVSLDEMDVWWNEAKAAEKGSV